MHIVIALKQAGDRAGAYGPFPTLEDATAWADANLPAGTYKTPALKNPQPQPEAAPAPEPETAPEPGPAEPTAEEPSETPAPEAPAGQEDAPAVPRERLRPLKERIQIIHVTRLTREQREVAISVDWMESPLACLFNLRNKGGGPTPLNNADTLAKYRAWLDERLAAKDERIRNVLNALYQALRRGHDLILTTRGPTGRYSAAFEIKRRLINAFATPCQPCAYPGLTPYRLHPRDHVWSPEEQTLVTDRYGLLPHIRYDERAARQPFKPRHYIKQRGPRGKAFFENTPANPPRPAVPLPANGQLEEAVTYQVTQG